MSDEAIRFRVKSALVLGTILAMQATTASAQKAGGDTPLILLGSRASDDIREVKKGDSIITTRVVYALMSIADEDINGRDGSVSSLSPKALARKGAQLFGVTERDGMQKTYCSVDHKETGALEGVFVRNADKHSCFIDKDGDGEFDSSYDMRTKLSPLVPLYYDVETVGNPLTRSVGYTPIDPEKCQLPMWLDIYVQKISNAGKSVTIGVRMRTANNSQPFTLNKRVELGGGATQRIRILGAEILLDYNSKDSVSAKVFSNIVRQDFSASRPSVNYQIMLI